MDERLRIGYLRNMVILIDGSHLIKFKAPVERRLPQDKLDLKKNNSIPNACNAIP